MARDYFAILGLAPGRHDPREVARHFRARREQLLAALNQPDRYGDSRRQLEELHLAYAVLSDPQRQARYLRGWPSPEDAPAYLKALIAASLEGGLLRYSRRMQILEQARQLGISDFQAQLLIAQVQFGGPEGLKTGVSEEQAGWLAAAPAGEHARPGSRTWARAAGVGLLAAALFLFLLHWLGV